MEANGSKEFAPRGRVGRTAAALLGVVLLAAWLVWWGDAIHGNRLRGEDLSWLPIERVRGIDFYPNYFSGRAWAEGRDPYAELGGRSDHPRGCSVNCYPPPCVWHFGWCAFTNLRRAKTVWLLASAAVIVAA